MASKSSSSDILASSSDIVENFSRIYDNEEQKPPASVLHSVVDDIVVRSVPTARYTDQSYHERERTELWGNVWQVVCWGGDIPEAGDIKLYDNAGISAIVVRQEDGSLKAFYNSCLHRGMRLCNKEGSRRHLTCRFHGYSWDTKGQCRNIPQSWDFPQLCKDELSLPELAVDVWQGFIFVHPNPDAEPLESFLGGLSKQWEDCGWSLDKRYKAVHVRKRIRCNWKVAQEAFMEGYHGAAVHPDTIIPAAPYETFRADVFPGEATFSRGLGSAGVLASDASNAIEKQQAALDHFVKMYTPEFSERDDLVVTENESARDIMHRLSAEKLL